MSWRGRGLLIALVGALGCAPPADADPAPIKAPVAAKAPAPAKCAASASWFSSPSFPTEVPGGQSATDCSFQQLAWQAFIDVVQPVGGRADQRTFETYMPDYGVFVPAGTPVTPWGQQPGVPCKLDAANASEAKRVFLRPRVPKGPGFDPDSDLQASGQALYDQQRQVVYYSIWINQTEYNFITNCSFNNTSCVTSAPATTAITPGAVELKGSWRVFHGPAPKDMYAIRGVINELGKDGKPSQRCTPVTLGLVGFHLVMNTPLHPEFVWATFEHKRNAPDCGTTATGDWSFNNPRCTGTNCQINHANTPPTPTQVCRVAPGGGGGAENVGNIQAINQAVHQTLAQLLQASPAKYAAMAIWQNYDLTGNLWTVNGAVPPTTSNEAGSLLAANTTMETYVQGAPPSGSNCFGCHTVSQFVTSKGVPMGFQTGAPANFSHLWGFAQQTGGCAGGKLPAACPVTAAAIKPKPH